MIIGCDLVEYFFPTFLTAVFDHIPLVFTVIDTDRIHLTLTKGRSIPRTYIIDMTRTETKRAMIAGGSFGMWYNLLVAVFTLK